MAQARDSAYAASAAAADATDHVPADDQLIALTRRLSLELEQHPPPHLPLSPPSSSQGTRNVGAIGSDHLADEVAAGVAADARPHHGGDEVDRIDEEQGTGPPPASLSNSRPSPVLGTLPDEIIFNILEFLDVNDVLSTSRTNRQLRQIALDPLLHTHRLRRVRELLPPLLWRPDRPSLANLISRSIFLTNTSVVSRRLARSLVSIRLSRRLAARPSIEALVDRAVLPKECVPGMAPVHVSPTIVQRRMAVERELIKDGLRRWIDGKWRGEVREREESQRRWEESRGIGRVWRLRRFWERIGKRDELTAR